MKIQIEDLLEYSRINTRKDYFKECDLSEVLGMTIAKNKTDINEKNAIITNHKLPQLNADKKQMLQLFDNLLENGIKYCETEPRIHIFAEERVEEVEIIFEDNGIGIAPEYHQRIFSNTD